MAVGFLDEVRIVVGSHSGFGVFEAKDGTRLHRVDDLDGGYPWFHDFPPRAAYTDGDGQHLVDIAGIWGGSLPASTDDGWTAGLVASGGVLAGPGGAEFTIEDDDEPRACGFSPHGQVFVFATSATLYVAVRSAD